MTRSLLTRLLSLAAISIIPVYSVAQTGALIDGSLRGTWHSTGYPFDTSLTFGESQALTVATRPSKGNPARNFTELRGEGVYVLGASACSVDGAHGNLYMAHRSSRCCFQARIIGSVLVLDEIRSASTLPQLPGGLCESKTMARPKHK